ncbi:hypothetical protein D3C81_1864230 [compost metagenome]
MCATMLCLGSVLIAIEHYREQSKVMEQLVPHIHLQKQSVSGMNDINENLSVDLTDPFVLYSGSHILYGLRDWLENNVEVLVDGDVLINADSVHFQNQTVESILKQGIMLLEPDSNYRSITQVDGSGHIVKIFFVKS